MRINCSRIRCGLFWLFLISFGSLSLQAASDARLKEFAALKRQQMEALAVRLHLEIPGEAREFFRAAEKGDWGAVSNSFTRIQQLSGSLDPALMTPGYTNALYVPIHETLGAYDEFQRWDPALLKNYAEGILNSIPSGSIYIGGTDPGRFVITEFHDVAKAPEIIILTPKFVITRNAVINTPYLDYLQLVHGVKMSSVTESNVNAAFHQYIKSVEERMKHGDMPGPEEQVTVQNGKLQVSGAIAVMAINDDLVKLFFEHNREQYRFYLEQSYPTSWMYPYLEPHGMILRLNSEPLEKLDPAIVAGDRQIWDGLTKELLNDPRFIGHPWVRQTYGKMRSQYADLYRYRHLTSEAESAFKQAVLLAPASPEPVYRLTQLYLESRRFDEAAAVMEQFKNQLSSSADKERTTQAIAQIHKLKSLAAGQPKKP